MTVAEFLLKLAADDGFRAEYLKNPNEYLKDFDDDVRELLLKGALSEIRYEVKLETEVESETAVLVWIHVLPWLH